MLNTRNVVTSVAGVTVLSLLIAVLSLWRAPAGSGLGIDTYGTRFHGLLGLFEILDDLHVPVERAIVPPNRLLNRQITLALIEPSPELVRTEPAYLRDLGKWVRSGGSLVVAPAARAPRLLGHNLPSRNVLAALGLEDVHLEQLESSESPPPDAADEERSTDPSRQKRRSLHLRRTAREFAQLFGPQKALKTSSVQASAVGSLTAVFPNGLNLELPDSGRSYLESDSESVRSSTSPPPDDVKSPTSAHDNKHQKPSPSDRKQRHDDHPTSPAKTIPEGAIRAVLEPGGDPQTIAAVYALGSGTIAVLADPRLAQNRLIGRGDNAVLVSHLLADPGRPIVFDEFYHGLTVRSNPLWLLSRFPYGILAVTVLAAALLAGWRGARFLGPPLAPRPVSRRSLSEYVEAMARLLNRCHKPVPFILAEIRQGLFWRVRHEYGLAPGPPPDDAERIVRLLRRRDPALAENMRDAVRALDDSLAHPDQSAKLLEKTFAKVSLCVPLPPPRHAV